MTKDDLFKLYKKVQNKDRNAEDMLIAEHKKMFPKNYFHKNGLNRNTDPDYRNTLHMMYMHLTK